MYLSFAVPTRLLAIAAELSAPPSSPTVFRELSMLASIYHHYDVVSFGPKDMLMMYDGWFRVYGLYDYLTDLIPEGQIRPDEITVEVTGGPGSRLTVHNLRAVLAYL